MKFNENLVRLRRTKGLSQEELGNEINVARQTVSKWELGETTPEMDKLVELSKLFDVSIDELVGNEQPKIKKQLKKISLEYEYKSKHSIKKIPLVHINIGKGKRTAKGLIAIGNKAIGLLSIGGISGGLISFGGVSIGLLSLGGLSLALLFSLGGLSVGTFAMGGFAIGIYSIGGIAFAKNIACGGYANAHIAIGQYVSGANKVLVESVTPTLGEEIKNIILKELPKTHKIIVYIYSHLF